MMNGFSGYGGKHRLLISHEQVGSGGHLQRAAQYLVGTVIFQLQLSGICREKHSVATPACYTVRQKSLHQRSTISREDSLGPFGLRTLPQFHFRERAFLVSEAMRSWLHLQSCCPWRRYAIQRPLITSSK